MDDFRARYRSVSAAIDAEFERNRRRHGKRMHCRRGCRDCCHHIFQISEIEAADISNFARQLPKGKRARLMERAKAYLPAREAIMKQYGYVQAWGSLPRPEIRLPCPALFDGVCVIYDHRPLICRRFGMPLHHPEHPSRIFACELNFRPGEPVNDERLIVIQSKIAAHWRRTLDDYYHAGGKRQGSPISVAHAILEDFEDYLPP